MFRWIKSLIGRRSDGTRTTDQAALNRADATFNLGPGAINFFTPAATIARARAAKIAFARAQQPSSDQQRANFRALSVSPAQVMRPGLGIVQRMQSPPPAGSWSRELVPTQGPPLERQISVGEFVGWRIWQVRVADLLLESYSAGRIWLPGEPMTGKPSDHGYEGVWAFKSLENAISKIPTGQSYEHEWAIGTVWLWGEVIEHEIGYRAEFAEVRHLANVSFQTAVLEVKMWLPEAELCNALRRRYGVAGAI